MRLARLLVALAILGAPLASRAGDAVLPSDPNILVARFPGGATAVTVDVVQIGGSQLANDVAATRLQLDSANTDAWYLNLQAVSGYPVDCVSRTFLARFNPDASDCAASPSLCVEVSTTVGGTGACLADDRRQTSTVRTSTVVSAQGITSEVLRYSQRLGENPIKWIEIDVASDETYSAPEKTYWVVYQYAVLSGIPYVSCTVVTTTNPATTLPSFASCS